MSNRAIMGEIGKRLKRYRLNANITQKELADKAGVSVLSVQNIETGQFPSMATMISVLRVLEMLNQFDQLIPEPPISPIEMLKMKGRIRKRASGLKSRDS